MSQLVNPAKAKLISYSVAICYLVIHIVMLLVFWHSRILPMFYFNIFSVCFYLAALYVISRGWFRLFVVATYLEVVLHMTLAVLITGWDAGFQITLIGTSVLAFFAEYMGRVMQMRYIHALPLCILGMCAYLASFIVDASRPAAWPLPEDVAYWLHVTWCIITFTISVGCLQGFTLLTFHTEKQLSSQVTTDALTGLPNRYYVSLYGQDYAGSDGWVAMLDIDDFKSINDTYGHNFGDEVLRTLARLMREHDPEATACRWGGEEFLLLGKTDDITRERDKLDRFRADVEHHAFFFEGQQLHLTITIGLAAYEPGTELIDWVNMADKKLYLGKRSGKNQVVL